MSKLVEHEVDVVALRSFRPKDYADVGCSQEDSALITQAIRKNPAPAAKPTVDLPVGTENAEVPQPVILDGAAQQQPPPLPAAGCVGGLQSISAEEAAARLQGGGNGMVELAPGEAEMRHQQFLFEQQQQAQAMMYMQDGYPQHYQQQAPYPPPQFAQPNPYYAQPTQHMMPTQQQMMMSMMQPPMMYPNDWSRAPFGTWFCGCCGCPNHPNAAICGGCNEPHRLFAGTPPSAFSKKKKKGGKSKKQHKKKPSQPATPTRTLQKRDSPPATPSSSPTILHSDRKHDAPHGLRDTDEKEKQAVKTVESKSEDGKSQPEPEDSEEEPELLFGSESVDAADETVRQLDDQFAETEKHAKVGSDTADW